MLSLNLLDMWVAKWWMKNHQIHDSPSCSSNIDSPSCSSNIASQSAYISSSDLSCNGASSPELVELESSGYVDCDVADKKSPNSCWLG
ncbi:hypothetical protein L2E82_06070 [Cichorium intybus]|uniref:Uncharacterized protein n=1 Tax=Cichorium intybus TaxID=13427 RepID=A0ACB9H9H2_CICIN|nr:hypothetical protein L2E82_06070 [Cichorium intybus]